MVGRHRAAQSVGGVRLKCTANGRNLRLFSFQLNRIALYIGIGLLGRNLRLPKTVSLTTCDPQR
jgi:hypothetical protein